MWKLPALHPRHDIPPAAGRRLVSPVQPRPSAHWGGRGAGVCQPGRITPIRPLDADCVTESSLHTRVRSTTAARSNTTVRSTTGVRSSTLVPFRCEKWLPFTCVPFTAEFQSFFSCNYHLSNLSPIFKKRRPTDKFCCWLNLAGFHIVYWTSKRPIWNSKSSAH